VTSNHKPTVGIPHIILGSSHINDEESDIIVEEEVWIGVNSTLLAGSHIGRGAIIGASSMVNREIPPYAVAVGSPAKIIASVFTLEQVLEHERVIYPEQERFTREYLERIFRTYYSDKKAIGLDNHITTEYREKIKKRKKQFGIEY
jgi:acyl-[acyl carrier protein]--UDP-N-acetylglucosamine O-acyltransferase